MTNCNSILKLHFFAFISCLLLFSSTAVFAIKPKPVEYVKDAEWWGQAWGVVKVAPSIAKKGTKLRIQGVVVGGPAADPYWGCTTHGWVANGTYSIGVYTRGISNSAKKSGGDEPAKTETCYCNVGFWGASGENSGCPPPDLFARSPEQSDDLATHFSSGVTAEGEVDPWSFNYWDRVAVEFTGNVSVGHSDRASDYVLMLGDLSELEIDTDNDGIPDIWEIAHDPTLGSGDPLGKFSGGPVEGRSSFRSTSIAWRADGTVINPFAPREEGWVSGGINDWDGDGISNKDEYLSWYNNLIDDNGIPFDPTVINQGTVNFAASQASDGIELILDHLKSAKLYLSEKPATKNKKKLKKYKLKKAKSKKAWRKVTKLLQKLGKE